MCSDSLTNLSTTLAHDTSPDANVFSLMTIRQFGCLCKRITDTFNETQPYRGTSWQLMAAFIDAYAGIMQGQTYWVIREATDGWDAYLDGSPVFSACVNYDDGSVYPYFPTGREIREMMSQ